MEGWRDELNNDMLTGLIRNQLDLLESGSIDKKSAVPLFKEIVDHIQTGHEVYEIDEDVFLRLQKLRDSVFNMRTKIEEEKQSNISCGLFFNILSIVILSSGTFIVVYDFNYMEIPWLADVLFSGQFLFVSLLLLMLYYVYSIKNGEPSGKEIKKFSMNERSFSECLIGIVVASSEYESRQSELKIQENIMIRKKQMVCFNAAPLPPPVIPDWTLQEKIIAVTLPT